MWKVWDFLLHFTYFTWLFISISTRRFITSCMWQAGQLLHCDNWSVCCRLTRSATPCSACSPTWRRGTRSSGGPDLLRMRTWATPPPAAVSAPEARDTPHISDEWRSPPMSSLTLHILCFENTICDLIYTTYVLVKMLYNGKFNYYQLHLSNISCFYHSSFKCYIYLIRHLIFLKIHICR